MNFQLDPSELRPLIETITQEVVQQVHADHQKFNGRIALTEPEAAAKLGVNRHQLRDWRRRELVRSHKPGKQILYIVEELVEDIKKL